VQRSRGKKLAERRRKLSRDRRAGLGARGQLHVIAFQVTIQAGAPDTQHLCGAQAIAHAHLQHPVDVYFADFLE
jgi:hypothetical protein